MSANLTKPMQSPGENPRLEFCDGQFLFKSRHVDGGFHERFISEAAAREAFSGIPIDSGWLKPEIVRWGDGRVGEWAVAFIPPGVHEIEVTREEINRTNPTDTPNTIPAGPATIAQEVDRIITPLPGLVFFGLALQYWVWAVKTPQLDPYQEIYRCPLPNVDAAGSICWGPFKPPRCTARAILEAFDLFIKTTFNNHLAEGKSKKSKEDVRVVLREVAEAKERWEPWRSHDHVGYPVADLVRQVAHVGVTLDQAIRGFFETGAMPE